MPANHVGPPAPANHENRIVPDEDPQRDVSSNEADDGVESLCEPLGDGIGFDDEDGDSEDETDPGEADVASPDASNSRGQRRPLPTWLMTAFSTKVVESAARGPDGLPPLYKDHHDFWFPRPSPFFIMQKESFSPQDLYNPRFFLWDPAVLSPGGVPCPKCKKVLHRHGPIRRPRRCVDLHDTFWMIGYRYRCPSCVHPTSGRHTVTFRSWDSRILAGLSQSLSAEFPARLSHRSGISLPAFSFMRSCFQNGMGAKQFSDALRIQHLQRYDELHLQYLHSLAQRRGVSMWRGQKFKSFLPFEDTSPDGLHAFIPSSQWLRDMYDQFIEQHKDAFNQHTAMLSADICAIDHSHKVTKHVAKVDGEQVFTGLLTVTNEKGEMRVCSLVGTKAHSQFELALKRMRQSLNLYGHSQPIIFYTDNMSDKQFLEESFPSLLEDVVPTEKYAHLEPISLPVDTRVFVKQASSTIDDAIRTILDSLPQNGGNTPIAVGFDSEWNVDVSAHGYVRSRGETAVIQIAHGNSVLVLQVGQFLADRKLPHQLKLFLANPNILKVGRQVKADLRYLEQACQSTIPFNETLSDDQIRYAALDAYASLAIYLELDKILKPHPLPRTLIPSTPVLLYNDDHTFVIARGHLSTHLEDKSFDGINITATRTVVEVREVLVPGAIMKTHRKRPLGEFGAIPFHVICLRSHVCVSAGPLEALVPPPSDELLTPHQSSPSSDGAAAALTNPSLSVEVESSTDIPDSSSDGPGIGDLLHGEIPESSNADPSPAHIPDHDSQALGDRILGNIPTVWLKLKRSRVLKDAFHLFNMFYISVAHGLRVEFAQALRDALFIPDDTDKHRILAWASTQNPPPSWDTLLRKKASWLWRHCKRSIPPPEQLYPLVFEVFRTYGPLKDAKTGSPLFNAAAWKTAKNILTLIQNGSVSDPPGIPLYYCIGVDRNYGGLPVYRCVRGTNMTEGGVHTHLRSRLPTSGVSPRHVLACLLDFILRHNLLVGTFNSTGQRYRGHFSIWVTNELQEKLIFLEDMLLDSHRITGWVNGNLYQQTSEVSGILPIPDDVRRNSGMSEFDPVLDSKQHHHFLAAMQGTRKPILPIHTLAEKELFSQLMREDESFNSPTSAPNWKQAVKVWNRFADVNEKISYKLVEQLMVYYADWKTNLNIRQTLSMTNRVRQPVRNAIRDPQRSRYAPPAPERQLQLHTVNGGLLSMPAFPEPPITTSSRLTLDNMASLFSGGARSTADALARKRAADTLVGPPEKRPRKPRTCRKCAVEKCPGRRNINLCKSQCRDCGNVACRGRNSKDPNKPCHRGWD
ncbi:hypothetical protein FPV67DRAFT_1637573 [Lyophyllum atratum]|nr:hypothetical protein FPV67DRAFT_1637573 [Lyophyllum atratum]